MSVKTPTESGRFIVLDGMRGLAALVVITDHIYSPTLTGFFAGRYLAVDFFFALSGFVLARAYAQRLTSGMSALEFLRVRIIRLYPLYLVGTLASVLLASALVLKGWTHTPWADIAVSAALALFMLPCPPGLSTQPSNIYPLDGPAWSLFFELFINVIFALIFRWLTIRALVAIMAVSAVALIFSAFHYGQLDGGFAWDNFLGGFPRVFYDFFAGVLVYRMHAKRPAPALPAWLAFVLLLAILAIPGDGMVRTLRDLVAAIALFPLLLAFSANAPAGGMLGRSAATLGLLSYGIYVLHVPIRDWINTLAVGLAPHFTVPGGALIVVVAIAAILAAAMLDAIYDTPVRRWLSHRGAARATQP
jgi:peptidoglycan/LPS O-acetylase OafA/YrhL